LLERQLDRNAVERHAVLPGADENHVTFGNLFPSQCVAAFEPEVAAVSFDGLDDARPSPGVLDALADADLVILCPSNPFLSIGPIMSLVGVNETLGAHPRVIAVSPIVRGAALRGPADRLLESLGAGAGASAVARLYAGFCDVFVVDASDPEELALVEELGIRAVALPSIMRDHSASERLASSLLEL